MKNLSLKKLIKSTLLIASFFVVDKGFAQYNGGESAAGLRLGGSIGVTYKKFFNNSIALETIIAKDFEKDFKGIAA